MTDEWMGRMIARGLRRRVGETADVFPHEFALAIHRTLRRQFWPILPLTTTGVLLGWEIVRVVVEPGRTRSLVIPLTGALVAVGGFVVWRMRASAYRELRSLLEGRMCECGYVVEGMEQCPECGKAVVPMPQRGSAPDVAASAPAATSGHDATGAKTGHTTVERDGAP
jgi:hypothetical protein